MNEFAKNGDHIVVNVPYAEAYIPYDLIGDSEKGKPNAFYYGEGVKATGLFNMRFFDSIHEDKVVDRSKYPIRTFNYPNVITMYPSDKEILTLQLSPDMDEDKYLVLKFEQGDIMMSTKIPQNSKNCEAFMDLLIKGKVPRGLSYTNLYLAWMKNFQINGIDPGVPAITIQMIISENCRSKDDPSISFRKVIGKGETSETDYRVHNMADICSNSSVMNALTFERFSQMLTYSLNMSDHPEQQTMTPLEKVLTM